MGTCQCENNTYIYINYNNETKELKNFFSRKNARTIQEQPDIIKTEKQKKIRIIKKFIIKNMSRLYKKEKYKGLKMKSRNLFFEEEQLNFQYNKSFFEQKLNKLLTDYFKGKEKIINDLFPYNLIGSLHSFPKLRDKISSYHNDNTLKNKKEYLDNFISFLTDNNLIKTHTKKPNLLSMSKYSFKGLNNMENEESANLGKLLTKKTLKEDDFEKIDETDENRKNNSIEDLKISKKESKVKFNLSWDQINKDNLMKKEIDNFFDVCFGSTKKNFAECQKKSIFLNILIFQEYKKIPKINFTWKLKTLVKLLYYLYLLKKYNFLSDTNNCFYKINSFQMKKKSIIRDKIILNKRESFQNNELKIKLLKKAMVDNFNNEKKIQLESNVIDSMSSILSEEDEKEYYSLISASNEVKLLKTMANEDEKINKIKIEEEKNDNKSELGKMNYGNIINREKCSFQDMIQKVQNLKTNNNIRLNKRTKTTKKNKAVEFIEYYNGQFDETVYLFAGLGTLVSQNLKKLYYGTFRYGCKEGMGILYEIIDEKCMEYYMGEFHDNKIDGYGIKIKIKENNFIYQEGIFEEGDFIKGKLKKIEQRDESIITFNYEGEVKENKLWGLGQLIENIYKVKEGAYYVRERTDYSGEFKYGEKNGNGIETFNDIMENMRNYEYNGNFHDGIKEGYGKITFEKNNFVTRYEGFFKKDRPFQIYGIVNFKSGDIYEGFFDNNIKNYIGLYSFYDNKSKKIIEQYFGGFLDDSKNGIGKTIVEEKEGKMLIGTYKRGEKEGQFEKIIFRNKYIENRKKSGKALTYRLSTYRNNSKSDEKLPREEIKSFPVYEENEIIDNNDNFFFKEV